MTDFEPPFTTPFNYRTTAADAVADIDLSGKVIIVTGGSSGIGVETCRAFAGKGAHVILAVRNLEKGQAVADDIKQTTNNDNVECMELDLNSLESVRNFTDAFLAKNLPLNILVNNAGIMAVTEKELTADGFEKQFGVCHLGHFLMTGRLFPALQKGAEAGPVRVVSLASTAHLRGGVDFDDIMFENRDYNKWVSYAQAKSSNVLFAVELNRRLKNLGIGSAFSVHPGGIATNLQSNLSMEEMKAMGWFDEEGNVNPLFKTIEQGAATSCFAATSPLLNELGGLYLEDCNVYGPRQEGVPYKGYAAHALEPETAKKLWTVSEGLVGETFDFGN